MGIVDTIKRMFGAGGPTQGAETVGHGLDRDPQPQRLDEGAPHQGDVSSQDTEDTPPTGGTPS